MSEVPSNNAPGTPGAVDSSGQAGFHPVQSGGFTNEQIQTMTQDLVSSGQLSEQQGAAMYVQTMVDSGAMTREQAAAHLKAVGGAPQAGTLEQMIDRVNNASSISPLQPEVRKHLESLGMRPARDVSEYRFPTDSEGGFLAPDEAQADMLGRNWLMSAGFSADTGSLVASEIVRVGTAFEAMSEIDREIWLRQQELLARKTLGEFGQDANARIELAKRLVSEIDARYPGLKQFLDETGCGSSAVVVAAFVAQAEALARA